MSLLSAGVELSIHYKSTIKCSGSPHLNNLKRFTIFGNGEDLYHDDKLCFTRTKKSLLNWLRGEKKEGKTK